MNNPRSEWEVEIARRLCAAALSYQLGTKFEKQLQTMGDEAPGEFWLQMAELVRGAFDQLGRDVQPKDTRTDNPRGT